MGITMEMYAADPEEFVSLQKRLASELTSEEEGDLIFKQLRDYPQADFSLHLHWPEDIDALCQAMIAEGVAVPPSRSDLLVEELWFDGMSACVNRLSQEFPLALAQTTEETLKHIAEHWVRSYIPDPSIHTVYYTTAYDAAVKALSDLRQASRDAFAQRKPLLLYLQW
jgi:hypothetical protein